MLVFIAGITSYYLTPLIIILLLLIFHLNSKEKTRAPATIKKKVKNNAIHLLYAANVNENTRGLEKVLEYAKKQSSDIVILTNLLGNPLTKEEQSAYHHAYQHVYADFKSQNTFADVQQYINSYAKDSSRDILAKSANKILKLIRKGSEVIQKRASELKKILKQFDQQLIIVPGPFENLDVIRSLDEELFSYYLNLRTIDVKNIRFLGIGGLVTEEKSAPLYFQNRDYIEGTEQSHEELKQLFFNDIDILISYTPIRYFSDNEFEEKNVRQYLSDYLPGKLILTSQALSSNPMNHSVTASDAALIKGGSLSKEGHFWDITADRNGLVDKRLINL